jgi:hypothetical protein
MAVAQGGQTDSGRSVIIGAGSAISEALAREKAASGD